MSNQKFKIGDKVRDKKRLPFNRVESYSLLKFATEKYMALCSNDKTKEEVWIHLDDLELV
jgi:hypothetical protein